MKIKSLFEKFLPAVLASCVILSVAGCSSATPGDSTEIPEEEEEVYQQTLTIEDEAYYQRFKGQNISINVYNWGEYISEGEDEGTLAVNREFEELTGINVNYTTFATNEELYAKLKGGGASYDVIIPSDYMISKMIKEEMIQKLDYDNIPNFKYIMDNFRNLAYDPDNEYSVPYTWGTVGIIYNKDMVDLPKEEIDWDILWDETYRDQILMFDNPRDAFAIAEVMLGYNMNTEDPDQLKAASEKLKEQKSIVQAYVMDEIFDKMIANDAWIAPYYAGDALTILEENEDLDFVVPKSGTNLFVDSMCIPVTAKQKEAAEMYINFMCEPDIAYSNIDYICYSTPHSAAYEMLDEEVQNDPVTYPDQEILDANTTVFVNLSDEASREMQTLWTDMKSAQDENTNQWIVPVFLAICIALIIGILIRRYIKSKKDIF